jgi:hypothetical protein
MINVECNDSELEGEMIKRFESGETFKFLGFEYMPTNLVREYCSLLGYSVKFSADQVRRVCEPWNGQGLPPVGTDCEFTHTGLSGEWVKCHVVGYYKGHMYGHTNHHLWDYKDGACHVQLDEGPPTAVIFRPIRTPEQLAAEEREAAIGAMAELSPLLDKGWSKRVCEALYDAGYRPTKQDGE